MCKRRGQSTVEYAVVISVIIAALIAMQIYMKRGAMGKLRESTDQIGEQFSPGQASWNVTVTYNSNRTDQSFANGFSASNVGDEQRVRNGSENLSGNNITTENLF